MKALLDCIVCQQRQALRIAHLVTNDPALKERILREVMSCLARVRWDTDPMTLTAGIYEIVERLTGNPDPYKELKAQSNREALAWYPRLQKYVTDSPDPLFTACKLAAAGNIMDFGAKDAFDLQAAIQRALEAGFAVDDYGRFTAALERASKLLVFADNAGEIVFDRLLFETLLSRHPSLEITMVVKASPIINDATLQDVKETGLDSLPAVRFRTIFAGKNGSGASSWITPEVEGWIRGHDVILSKGQANYEILNTVPDIFFLLIVKCPLIGREIGARLGDSIFKYGSESFGSGEKEAAGPENASANRR